MLYDFEQFTHTFEKDVPVLLLSEAKTLLTVRAHTTTRVPRAHTLTRCVLVFALRSVTVRCPCACHARQSCPASLRPARAVNTHTFPCSCNT